MTKQQKWVLFGLYLAVVAVLAGITYGLVVMNAYGYHESIFILSFVGFFGMIIFGMITVVITLAVIINLPDLWYGESGDYFFGYNVGAGTILYNRDSGSIEILASDMFIWWSKGYSFNGNNLLNPPMSSVVKVTTRPITTDPQLRPLTCLVTINPPETADDYIKLLAAYDELTDYVDGTPWFGHNRFPYYNRPVESLLYDFCAESAESLKQFSNPYSKPQQETFKNLVIERLQQKLADIGLSCSDASFGFAKS